MEGPQLIVGVRAGLERVHTIIIREEADGTLRLMGEHRNRQFLQAPAQETLVERMLQSILGAIDDAQVDLADILTIGVASPGQIDLDNGTIMFSTRFNLRNVPIVAILRQHFACPISLINIVDAQAMGEQRLGVGREVDNLFYIHVAHYIGASIIIDGKLYLGTDRFRNEFGHMIIDPNGLECECGHRGCLETFSAGPAIGKKLRSLISDKRTTSLAEVLARDPLDLNGARIAQAIDQEDPLAIEVVVEAAEVFGIGIANVINLLSPRMIVLSGDMVDEIQLYFETAVASAKKRVLYSDDRNLDIVQGMLGTTAGAYGAAIYSKQRLDKLGGI